MKASDITREQFMTACKGVVDMARTRGWRYGNSTAIPPCSDGRISCDRLIARALYNLGFQDQRRGGETCGSLDTYLNNHGFIRSQSFNDIVPGSIILVKHNGLNYWSHAFVCLAFDKKTFVTDRYDTGSDYRIRSVQPLRNQGWGYRKDVVLVYNIPEKKKDAVAHKLTQTGQIHLREYLGLGGEPKADGRYTDEWKPLLVKAIQKAANNTYKWNLAVDGIYGPKTTAALEKHYLHPGAKNELVSALKIGLYLNNINPGSYEIPGLYDDAAVAAVNRVRGELGIAQNGNAGNNVFKYLIK